MFAFGGTFGHSSTLTDQLSTILNNWQFLHVEKLGCFRHLSDNGQGKHTIFR